MMLREWIGRAENGEPLWLPLLREESARDPEAAKVRIRLRGGYYGEREYTVAVPRGSGSPAAEKSGKERDFLLRYLSAAVYNLLSAFSAEEADLFYEEDRALETAVGALCRLFHEDPGLGKARRIARRLYGGFRIRALPMKAYPAETCNDRAGQGFANARKPESLAGLLKNRVGAAEERNGLGLDIGGSDIKAALSRRGELLYTKEIDWNPAACATADRIAGPILELVREAADRLRETGETLDAVGISFPDVVIGDRIAGGETPKTMGMRNNPRIDYEAEFSKLGALRDEILELLPSGASVRLANDGNMAAFTAAVELAAAKDEDSCSKKLSDTLEGGVLAHTLGTDLGTGWVLPDGSIPAIPLEMYDLLLDLGDFPSLALPPRDLRSTRNENSGMAGVRRYLGQSAAYRLAWKLKPALLDGYAREEDGLLVIPTEPEDLRKPCLAHLMAKAEEGDPEAEEVFRRIGENLAVVAREMEWIFGATPPARFLFGRFVKSARCFALLREGFDGMSRKFHAAAGNGSGRIPELVAADESMANSSLMRQLAASERATVAQFGQAVGAIYYALG